MYLKITNSTETHHGFIYKNGLNILEEYFNPNPNYLHIMKGLYFTTEQYICCYLHMGIYLRVIELPEDVKMVSDDGYTYRANKIIFRQRMNLSMIETFEWLHSIGTNFRIQNDQALRWASNRGLISVVKYLIKMGSSIMNSGCLIDAVESGSIDMVKYLLEEGADVNIFNSYALVACCNCIQGSTGMLHMLIAKGANLKDRGPECLEMATKHGKMFMVQFLLNFGVNSKLNNYMAFRTSVMINDENMAKILAINNECIESNNNEAIISAVKNNNLDLVKFLHMKGANIHVQRNKPLRISIKEGNLPMIIFLIEKGAYIRYGNDKAIKTAAQMKNFSLVKFLLEKNLVNYSALTIAIENGDLPMIKEFFNKWDIPKTLIKKAIDQAMKSNNIHVIKYLTKKN